ncbi:MAG: LAGLIDADG family homing endonuclease [Patescibacteria group bacterium]
MSDKVPSADNQQGRSNLGRIPSETTRRTPFNYEKEIKAYLLGTLHDGTFSSNKRFRIAQKGKDWLEVLKKLFKIVGFNAWIYKEGKERNVYVLETLASFLDFKFDPLKLKSKKEKIAYIKGFFDAEGGIPQNKNNRFYVQLAVKDKHKIEKIKKILESLKIKIGKIHNPSKNVKPDYWRMYVLSKSHTDFARLIGSWHPKKAKLLVERKII